MGEPCPIPGQTPTAGPAPTPGRTGLWAWICAHLLALLTGRDNRTLDLGRVSWVVCAGSVLAVAAWHEAHRMPVDLLQLATALSAVSAAHGVALGMKASTEPPAGGAA